MSVGWQKTPHLQSVFFEDIRKAYKIGEFADIKNKFCKS